MKSSLVLLLVLVLTGSTAFAQGQLPPDPASAGLGRFWPLDAPSRRWDLIARSQAGQPGARILMTVENERTGPDTFLMWFSNKEGQKPGERDGEQYRLCHLPGRTWLFMDGYIGSIPGRPPAHHRVVSDRLVLFQDGAATDLMANGEYRACGDRGQPYLLWSGGPWHYRMQVWGHLTENPRWHWFWDATISGPVPVTDNCLAPPERKMAVKVQELWWNNFKNFTGRWELGDGETDSRTGEPTGRNVRYGRTIWHGSGQLPYLLSGNDPAKPDWCVNRVMARRPEPRLDPPIRSHPDP